MDRAAKEKGIAIDAEPPTRAALRLELEREISRTRRLSNRGLWALSLFLLLSTLAWQQFRFLPPAEVIAASLGPPPAPRFISLLLVIYTFSAIVLSLSRMTAGIRHRSSFCHVAYLLAFYLFYHLAGGLSDNYWAVFGAGITILSMESFRIWTFCNSLILKHKERLACLERTGHLPPEESEESD